MFGPGLVQLESVLSALQPLHTAGSTVTAPAYDFAALTRDIIEDPNEMAHRYKDPKGHSDDRAQLWDIH